LLYSELIEGSDRFTAFTSVPNLERRGPPLSYICRHIRHSARRALALTATPPAPIPFDPPHA
jgi:hypothetical protein